MERSIRTLFFGENMECRGAELLLRAQRVLVDARHECKFVTTSDEYGEALLGWDPTLVIVLKDGAAGMEGVYQSRTRRPAIPVFWFSDDHDFGMQAYRLNCAYFSTKPVTAEKLTSAVNRCLHMGIRYEAV